MQAQVPAASWNEGQRGKGLGLSLEERKPRSPLGAGRVHGRPGVDTNCADIAVHELAQETAGNAELGWGCRGVCRELLHEPAVMDALEL